jgi:hypothetical protein
VEVEVKGEKGHKKVEQSDADEVREILSVVSDKVPALVKGLVTSIFSEDAARGMGKAAATYYQELKAGGIPDSVAVQMTKEYIGTFTKISEVFKSGSHETINKAVHVQTSGSKDKEDAQESQKDS